MGNETFEMEVRRRLDDMETSQLLLQTLLYGTILKQDQANIAREGYSEVIQPSQIESQAVQAFGQEDDGNNVQFEFNEVVEKLPKS